MSVLIKGMEMPNDHDIQIIVHSDGTVYVCGAYPTKLYKAIEVPPHGRLIDAVEVYKFLSAYYHHRTEAQHEALREALGRVPTIIEAEEAAPNAESTL